MKYIYYKLVKMKYKLNKLIEFYRLYKNWCIFFDDFCDKRWKHIK